MCETNGKIVLSQKVQNIAESLDLSKDMVRNILLNYIAYCRTMLIHGKRIEFLDMLYMCPDILFDDYRTTLAYECKHVADELHLPQHTVYVVVKAYLEDLEADLIAGRPIELRGLVAIKPVKKDNSYTIHSVTSPMVKKEIQDRQTVVQNVRCFTQKALKTKMALA